MNRCCFDNCISAANFRCNCISQPVLLCNNHRMAHQRLYPSYMHNFQQINRKPQELLQALQTQLKNLRSSIIKESQETLKVIAFKAKEDLSILDTLHIFFIKAYKSSTLLSQDLIQTAIENIRSKQPYSTEHFSSFMSNLEALKTKYLTEASNQETIIRSNSTSISVSSMPQKKICIQPLTRVPAVPSIQPFNNNLIGFRVPIKIQENKPPLNQKPSSLDQEYKSSLDSPSVSLQSQVTAKIRIPEIGYKIEKREEELNLRRPEEWPFPNLKPEDKWIINTKKGDKELPLFITSQIADALKMRAEKFDIFNKGKRCNKIDLKRMLYFWYEDDGLTLQKHYDPLTLVPSNF